MSRKGPRPHTWKIQDEIQRQQCLAWQRQRAQATFRGEPWDLSFEQFQTLWQEHWQYRGKARDEYCMTRIDQTSSWALGNVEVVTRVEQLRKAQLNKQK